MKYLIYPITILLFSCSTLPNHEIEDCEEGLTRLFLRHYQTPPQSDIHEACVEQVSKDHMIERVSNRR